MATHSGRALCENLATELEEEDEEQEWDEDRRCSVALLDNH